MFMLNITDVEKEQKIPAFFRLGFRPFFLSSAIFSVIAISIWAVFLLLQTDLAPYGGSYWWHGHEMIYGFATPVIVGFLLTAVQTWTGVPGTRGWQLFALYSIWLIARILILPQPQLIPLLVIAVIDCLFLPLAAVMMARPVLKVRQWRNLFFVPLLVVLALLNLLSHVAVLSPTTYPVAMQHANYGAIMVITLIMVVMGGRVIPFFTANATKIPRKPAVIGLELTALSSTWLVAVSFVFGLNFNPSLQLPLAVVAIFAGVANLIRWSRWRFTSTMSTPLLWSLHLAYLFIPVSFILLGANLAYDFLPFSSVLHGFTVGAMANLILAMMARVSLGHTGRQLDVRGTTVLAFLLIAIGATVRLVGTSFFVSFSASVWLFTALAWIAAFGLFSWNYWPVLVRPRIDGRPG